MESRLLGALGKVAGIGGIALGIFLLLFRGVLEKQFLPQAGLGSAQGFAVIISLMLLTFGLAGIGVIAWLIGRTTTSRAPIPLPTLSVLAALIAALLLATVYVAAQAKPDPPPTVAAVNRPTTQVVPPPPLTPARPISGSWGFGDIVS